MQQFFSGLLMVVVIALSACSSDRQIESQPSSISDSSLKKPARIVTLAPHLTELVYSLGVEDRLVGTVQYSDYPEAAKKIPRVGDAFQIDWERLTELDPDLVIVWRNGNPQQVIDELRAKAYQVLALENASLFNLPEQLIELAEYVGSKETAISLGQSYSVGLKKLEEEYSSKKTARVFYQISPEPLYTVDGAHVISEMLKVCGAENVFSNLGSIAAPVSVEAVLAANPDVILTTNEMHDSVVEKWSGLSAIRPENILSVSPDEVARASLRMLQGTKNICEALDEWRVSGFQ